MNVIMMVPIVCNFFLLVPNNQYNGLWRITSSARKVMAITWVVSKGWIWISFLVELLLSDNPVLLCNLFQQNIYQPLSFSRAFSVQMFLDFVFLQIPFECFFLDTTVNKYRTNLVGQATSIFSFKLLSDCAQRIEYERGYVWREYYSRDKGNVLSVTKHCYAKS